MITQEMARLDERGMLGDVVDTLAVEIHGAAVPKTCDVRVPASHGRANVATGAA